MEKPRKAVCGALAFALLLTLAHSSHTEPAPEKVLLPVQYIETPLQAENDWLAHESAQPPTPQPMVPVVVMEVEEAPADQFSPLAVPLPEDLQLLVWELCGEYETFLTQQEFFELVLKVMWNESRHQVDVPDNYNVNGTTDRGPMQINSVNWPQLAAVGLDVNQPEDNIEAGIRFLSDFLNEYQDVEYALTAYGYGPSGAHAKGGQSDTAKKIINLDLEEATIIEFG